MRLEERVKSTDGANVRAGNCEVIHNDKVLINCLPGHSSCKQVWLHLLILPTVQEMLKTGTTLKEELNIQIRQGPYHTVLNDGLLGIGTQSEPLHK